MEIVGKNIVYIGGSGGIGSATCKLFANKKVANLAILDLVECVNLIEEIKVLSPSTNVFYVKIDLRCKEDIIKCFNEVVSRISHIDILVNGSGLFNENDPELTIGLGVINTTLTAMNFMDKVKGYHGGMIVNLASVAGLSPIGTTPIYGASKAGVIIFTRSMAEQSIIKDTGISFITICPGVTETGLLNQFMSENKSQFGNFIEKSFNITKKQTADECAQSIMNAIETTNKTGAVYICDKAEMKEVTFPEYWAPERL